MRAISINAMFGLDQTDDRLLEKYRPITAEHRMDLTGLYKATFGTPLGMGAGVAYLQDGKLHGGDSMMAYVGTYNIEATNFTADVHVFQHSNVRGMWSTLGTSDAQLSISATIEGTTITGQGTSPEAPGVTLQVTLEKTGD